MCYYPDKHTFNVVLEVGCQDGLDMIGGHCHQQIGEEQPHVEDSSMFCDQLIKPVA